MLVTLLVVCATPIPFAALATPGAAAGPSADGAVDWGRALGGGNNSAAAAFDGPGGPSPYLAERWTYETGDGTVTNEGAAVANGSVYHWRDHELVAINLSTGAVEWNRTLPSNSDGALVPAEVSVAAGSGAVYVTHEALNSTSGEWEPAVFAFHASNGTTKWRTRTGSMNLSSYTDHGFESVAHSGDAVVATTGDGAVRLDAQTGATEWKRDDFDDAHTTHAFHNPPVVSDDRLLFLSADSDRALVHVVDLSTGVIERTMNRTPPGVDDLTGAGEAIESPLAYQGGTLYYAASGRLFGVDPTTGAETLNVSVPGSVEVDALAVSGERVVYAESGGNRLVGVDSTSGAVAWTVDLEAPLGTGTPGAVILNDTAYFVGSHPDAVGKGLLYGVDAATGTEVWTHTLDEDPDGPLAAAPGVLVVPGANVTALEDRTVSYANLTVSDGVAGESPGSVSVDVTNVGPATETYETTLTVDGESHATKTGSLAPGETKTVAFSPSFAFHGDYEVRVADLPARTLTVQPRHAPWSEFGGDAGDTGAPTGSVGPNGNVSTSWNATFPAAPERSPAVVDGVAFVASADTLFALNATTGAETWSETLSGGSPIDGPPAVSNGVVYAAVNLGSGDYRIHAVDAADGTERWTTSFSQTYPNVQRLAVANGTVYVASERNAGDSLYAFDASTGAERWNFTLTDGFSRGPLYADGYVVVGAGSTTYLLNESDGGYAGVVSSSGTTDAAIADGALYLAKSGPAVEAYDVSAVVTAYAESSSLGTPTWTASNLPGPYYANALAVTGERVYAGMAYGNVSALNATTGEVLWNHTRPPVSSGVAGIAVANGVVYHPEAANATMRALNASTGDLRWTHSVGTAFEDVAVADCTVYGVAGTDLYAVTGDVCGPTEGGTSDSGGSSDGDAGSGGTPDVSVSPSTHDLGNVSVGSTGTATLTVSNVGTADLNVTGTAMSGDVGQFAIVDDGTPFTLAPGASQDLTAEFAPSTDGTYAATLSVATNDTDEPNVDVALAGNGTGANRAPVAADDSFTVQAGQSLTVNAPGVLANDTDPDGDSIDAVPVTVPTNGTVTMDETGSFVYTPDSGFNGTDAFDYRAVDPSGNASAPATVAINVTGPAGQPPDSGGSSGSGGASTVVSASVRSVGATTPDMSNISASAFFSGGLLQIQLLNDSASGSDLDAQYDLEGLGVDDRTRFEITVEVENFTSRLLLGTGRNVSWTRAPGSTPNATELTIVVEPAHAEAIFEQSTTPWPTGADDRADSRMNETVQLAADNLSVVSGDRRKRLDGAIMATDAQTFGSPRYTAAGTDSPPELTLYVGGPHLTIDGANNTGFFDAFLPDALLAEWGVTDPAQLTGAYQGSARTVTARTVTGGMRVSFDLHYSDGDVALSASGSGGTDDGGSDSGGTGGSNTGGTSGDDPGDTTGGDDGSDGTAGETGDSGGDGSDGGTRGSQDAPDADGTSVRVDGDADVEVRSDGDGLHVDVSGATSGTSVDVELDDDGVNETYDRHGSALEGVSTTFENDTDFDMDVSYSPDPPAEAPPVDERSGALGYVSVDHEASDEAVEEVSFTFRVSTERLRERGLSPDEVVLYRFHDGEWTALETEPIGRADGFVRFRALSPGLSTFAIGSSRAEPALAVDDTSLETAGQRATVSAVVSNAGNRTGTLTVDLAVDGAVVDRRTVRLGVDEAATVTFERTFAPGTYDLAVDETRVGTVTVDAATATATPGATTTAVATTPPTTTTSTRVPGFGPLAAVAALLLSGLLAGRGRP